MNKLCLAALVGLGLSFAAGSAHAMPLAPLASPSAEDAIQVREGCGRGYERDRFGRCRPDNDFRRGPVVRIVPPVQFRSRTVERCRTEWTSRGPRQVCTRVVR
jgi:hypothetical protein